MMKLINKLRHILPLLLLSAISPAEAEELIKVTVVKYQILESNIKPYTSRMIVTPNRVRMDDDEDRGNYLLFSRSSGLIESVNHEEQTILVIAPKAVPIEEPFPLTQKTEKIPLNDVPAIAGIIPLQFQLSVNGEHCQSIVSAKGLLPDVVEAWRQFRRVLAGEHAATLPYIPADQQSGCDLALNTFAPEWFLDFGLPVQSMEVGGKGMLLIDYNPDESIAPELFSLPKEYRRYSAE